MPGTEINMRLYKMLLNINTICGWTFPAPELMDIFIEQLKLKFEESYRFLNIDEIEYAFRNYKAEDYGKNFNLHIFDTVIKNYLQDRKEVDQYEDNKKEEIFIENKVEQTNEELMNEVIERLQR